MRARAALLVAAFAAAACVQTATVTGGYEPPPPVASGTPPAGLLVVRPFADDRPPARAGSILDINKAFIPLLPWVTSDFERLDEAVRDESDEIRLAGTTAVDLFNRSMPAPPFAEYAFPRDMARAVAADLAASGLFERVEYSEAPSLAPEARYVLHGTLHATPLLRRYSSYGLGPAGFLLWYVGLPHERITATVELELALVDASSSATLWQERLRGTERRFATVYHPQIAYGASGRNSLSLPRIGEGRGVDRGSIFSWPYAALRDAMEAARPGLARALAVP